MNTLFTKNVELVASLDLQVLNTAESFLGKLIYAPESYFEIQHNANITTGTIEIESVLEADNDAMTNAVEVTDLSRFTYLGKAIETDLSIVSKLTTTNDNTNGIRIGYSSPNVGKPYKKIKYKTVGTIDMIVNSYVLREPANQPVN